MRILLLFILFISRVSIASTLEELELRQSILAREYLEILHTLPNSIEIAEMSLNQDNKELVNEHLTLIKSFFKKYDEFNLAKIDFFHAEALKRSHLEAAYFISLKGKLTKKMLKHLHNLETSRATYLDRKIYFGTEQDLERLDIGQTVLHHYGLFATEIRKERGEKTTRTFGPSKIVPFIDTPSDALKSLDRFLLLLWNAYFRTRTGKQDYAPIPEALQSVQRRLVKMRNVEVKWEGMENLEDVSHDGKTLNMFLINHANSFFDTSAQQAFPVKGMSAMGNVDVFFPAFLVKRMVKSDHMISVGHGDTTKKTIELVQKKQLNKFFLAIEGITGTGLYEMRPVLPLFHPAVYDSIERGLELKLYPVAFPDNFRLLNDWRNPIEGKIAARGVLQKPFSTEHCLGLRNATNNIDSISHLIRWSWFSTLNTNHIEVLSMPAPSEIQRRLNLMIWGE